LIDLKKEDERVISIFGPVPEWVEMYYVFMQRFDYMHDNQKF